MISGVSRGSTFNPSEMATRIFSRLDTNTDDSIDKTELQALADSGSNIDVSKMFSDLDSDGDGKVTKSETESALKKLGDNIQNRFARSKMTEMQPPDLAEMFKNADKDGNGAVDQNEFKSIAPEDSDDEMSEQIFNLIDTDGNGSIDETENEAALNKMGPASGGMPPMGPPPGPPPSDSGVSASGAVSVVNRNGSSIVDLLDALRSSDSGNEGDDQASLSINRLVSEIEQGMVYSQQGSFSSSLAGTQSLLNIKA